MKVRFAILLMFTLSFCSLVVNGLEESIDVVITPSLVDVLETYPGKFNDLGVLEVNHSLDLLKPTLILDFDENKFYLPGNLKKVMEVTDKPVHLSIVTRKNSSLGESFITISIRPRDIPNLILWEDSIPVEIQENPKIRFNSDYILPGEEKKLKNITILLKPDKSLSILFVGYKSDDLEVIPQKKIEKYINVQKEDFSYQRDPITVCKITVSPPLISFSPISGKIEFKYKKVPFLAFYPEIPTFLSPIVIYVSLFFVGVLLFFFGKQRLFKAEHLRIGAKLTNNFKNKFYKYGESFKYVISKKKEERKISKEKTRITNLLKELNSDLKKGKITQKAYEELYTEYKTALINLEEEEIKLRDKISKLKHEEDRLRVELEKLDTLNRLKGVRDYEYKRSKILSKIKVINKEIEEKSKVL